MSGRRRTSGVTGNLVKRRVIAADAHWRHDRSRRGKGTDFTADRDPSGYFGWAYPPLFFCVVLLLAAMPYAPAFLAWVGITACS